MTRPPAPVFVLGAADDVTTEQVCRGLGRLPGWVAPERAPDILGALARLLYAFELGTDRAGMWSLVEPTRFRQEVRRLADAVIAPLLAPGLSRVVERPIDAELLAPYLRGVWPEAVVVGVGDPAVGHAAGPDVQLTAADVKADPAAVLRRVMAAVDDHGEVPAAAVRAMRASSGRRRPKSPSTIDGASEDLPYDPAASPLHDRVVVVLGAARSGTTWLHRLVTAHPDVAGTETGETWLFGDVNALWASPARAVTGEGRLLGAIRRFCDDMLLAMRDHLDPSASYVCEKTPESVWRLPLLTALYPDARYLHVVRDGRDVALSMARLEGRAHDVEAAARSWASAVGAVQAAAPGLPHFREVRYESMLADPLAVVTPIWRWLGLEVTDAACATATARSAQRVTPLEPTGAVGRDKWRALSTADVHRVDAAVGGLLEQLGYRLADA